MADATHVRTTYYYLREEIPADKARDMYERAAASSDPLTELEGDVEGGFEYNVVDAGIKLVRVRVEPLGQ